MAKSRLDQQKELAKEAEKLEKIINNEAGGDAMYQSNFPVFLAARKNAVERHSAEIRQILAKQEAIQYSLARRPETGFPNDVLEKRVREREDAAAKVKAFITQSVLTRKYPIVDNPQFDGPGSRIDFNRNFKQSEDVEKYYAATRAKFGADVYKESEPNKTQPDSKLDSKKSRLDRQKELEKEAAALENKIVKRCDKMLAENPFASLVKIKQEAHEWYKQDIQNIQSKQHAIEESLADRSETGFTKNRFEKRLEEREKSAAAVLTFLRNVDFVNQIDIDNELALINQKLAENGQRLKPSDVPLYEKAIMDDGFSKTSKRVNKDAGKKAVIGAVLGSCELYEQMRDGVSLDELEGRKNEKLNQARGFGTNGQSASAQHVQGRGRR